MGPRNEREKREWHQVRLLLFRTNTVLRCASQFQYRHMLSTITSSIDGSHGDGRPFFP